MLFLHAEFLKIDVHSCIAGDSARFLKSHSTPCLSRLRGKTHGSIDTQLYWTFHLKTLRNKRKYLLAHFSIMYWLYLGSKQEWRSGGRVGEAVKNGGGWLSDSLTVFWVPLPQVRRHESQTGELWTTLCISWCDQGLKVYSEAGTFLRDGQLGQRVPVLSVFVDSGFEVWHIKKKDTFLPCLKWLTICQGLGLCIHTTHSDRVC